MAICVIHCDRNDGVDGSTLETGIVEFCREALNDLYMSHWIEPVYFDDKYICHTYRFFGEVGVRLYPKLSATPDRGSMSEEEWRYAIWEIAHNDIDKNKRLGVIPKLIVVKGMCNTWGSGSPIGGNLTGVNKPVKNFEVREVAKFDRVR